MDEYDPRAKLDDFKEGWIALSRYGGTFLSHAASELTSGLPYDPLVGHGTRYYLVRSALARGDAATARMFVNDWSRQKRRRSVTVSKFVPGDHYHVYGEKFDTMDAAQQRIRERGEIFDGLREVHVYTNPGD